MILLVDPDPVFLQAAESAFPAQQKLFLALSAPQAIELIRAVRFSVVLVGVDPPAAGHQTIQSIRTTSPDLPVIAIGSRMRRQLVEASRSGMAYVASKPPMTEWSEVLDRIRSAGA